MTQTVPMEVVGVRERRIARNVSQQAEFQINVCPLSSPYTWLTVCVFPFEDSPRPDVGSYVDDIHADVLARG